MKSLTDQTETKTNKDENDHAEESDCNATSSNDDNLVDSSLPPVDKKQQRITEFQRMKANCKPDELEQLKIKCEILVRDCIAGLLLQLSNDDFKAMEGICRSVHVRNLFMRPNFMIIQLLYSQR